LATAAANLPSASASRTRWMTKPSIAIAGSGFEGQAAEPSLSRVEHR
jgi:hypothetical protein